MRKRLKNIITRMLFDKELFYGSKYSPRMTMKEYDELIQCGFWIQSEHPHPPEVRMYYAMDAKRDFNLEKYFEYFPPSPPDPHHAK